MCVLGYSIKYIYIMVLVKMLDIQCLKHIRSKLYGNGKPWKHFKLQNDMISLCLCAHRKHVCMVAYYRCKQALTIWPHSHALWYLLK